MTLPDGIARPAPGASPAAADRAGAPASAARRVASAQPPGLPDPAPASSHHSARAFGPGLTPLPLLLGIFHRQIEGDHHLLELAQRRFDEVGLGAELYPDSVAELVAALEFRPLRERRYTLHLPRWINLLETKGRDFVTAFTARGRTDAYGVVVHDQREAATRTADYGRAVREMNRRLCASRPSPNLFIEYAVGLEVDEFAAIFEATADCERVGPCIDIGHVGVHAVRKAYAQRHPGQEVCRLRPDSPELRDRIADLVEATAVALPTVLALIKRLGRLGKPLHFHLHDGHPLFGASPYGVCDHLGFRHEIRLPFAHNGGDTLPLLYGPAGLERIVQTALATSSRDRLSFTLEIHPRYERLPLGPYEALFQNWENLRHAEQMNGWIELILSNLQLVREACGHAAHAGVGPIAGP